MGYNTHTREIERKIIENIETVLEQGRGFVSLWYGDDSFERHLQKRIRVGHVMNARDYLDKTLDCLAECDEVVIARHKRSWDNICYNRSKEWAVVFNEDGKIMTSYKIEKGLKSFEELHKEVGGSIEKGEIDERVREAFKRLRERYRELGE